MNRPSLISSFITQTLIWAATLVLFCAPSTSWAAQSDWRKGWEKLASRVVNLSSEQDEISLTHKGKIQKLVFEVRKASVNFQDAKVHLLNGAILGIPIRSIIRDGDRSRVIDLPGEARTVRKVVFTYESLRARRAEIVIWGKKN